MPSKRPVIALRLNQDLYDKIVSLADKEERSLSNFVEYLLKKQIDQKPKRVEQK